MIWFGWQPDVAPGNNRITTVPVARNPDGSAIEGIVRSELVTTTPTTTLNLSSGWFTALATTSYPTVSTDNRTPLADGFVPTLTVRAKEQAPRVPIPNSDWSFGACPQGGPVTASDTRICYPAGFKIGRFYELTYRAKDPLVLGLGFAAARDLGAFLKAAAKDDAGHDNPVLIANAKTIVMGSSQSGRFVRSLIQLGYNRDEQGRIVFDGAFPHIGGGLMPLDVRFGQPGRAAGTEQVDRLYPGASFPFAYSSETDPLTGAKGGILDRCTASATCPKIVHVATALEMWELRQSLGFTDRSASATWSNRPMCAVTSWRRRNTPRLSCRWPRGNRSAPASSSLIPTRTPGRCGRCYRTSPPGSRTASNRRRAPGRRSRPAPWWRRTRCIFRRSRPIPTAMSRGRR
jgi:hypothetical protein